jgi:5-methylcytosine-specific restriction endonuclease McrA
VSLRVCAEAGCPTLTRTRRCKAHTKSRQQRGYDADYERQLRSPEFVGATQCASCGEPFTAGNPKTGGHAVALRQGGKGSKILPHCRRCNYGWQRTNL